MNHNIDVINEHRLYISELRAQLDAANERTERLSIELEQTRKAEVDARYYDAYQMNEIESMQAIIKERDATIIAFQTRVTELRHDLNMVIDQRNAANARIAELEAAQAWVSVDERLPEPLVDVYVCNDGYGGKGWLSEKGVWYMGLYPIHVTHWMPLPPPPVTDVTP